MQDAFIQDCDLEIVHLPIGLIMTKNKYAVDFFIKNTGNVPSRFILKFDYPNLKCNISEKPEFDLEVDQTKDFSVKIQPIKSGLQELSIKVVGLIKKRIKSYIEVPNPNYKEPVAEPAVGPPSELNMAVKNIATTQPKTIRKEVFNEKVIENLILIKKLYLNVIDSDTAPKEIKHFINIGGDANPVGENIQSHLITILFYNPEIMSTQYGERLQFLREQFFTLKKFGKEPFYYITFPIDREYSKDDSKILQNAFNFFIRSQLPDSISKLNLFNVSFIPPFNDHPSIIVGKDDYGNYNKIVSKIQNLNGNLEIVLDNDLFKQGILYNDLKEITKNMETTLVNVVFTLDIIDNKELFSKIINLFQ